MGKMGKMGKMGLLLKSMTKWRNKYTLNAKMIWRTLHEQKYLDRKSGKCLYFIDITDAKIKDSQFINGIDKKTVHSIHMFFVKRAIDGKVCTYLGGAKATLKLSWNISIKYFFPFMFSRMFDSDLPPEFGYFLCVRNNVCTSASWIGHAKWEGKNHPNKIEEKRTRNIEAVTICKQCIWINFRTINL